MNESNKAFFTAYAVIVCSLNFIVFSWAHFRNLKKYEKVLQPQIKVFLCVINVSLAMEIVYNTVVVGF